MADKILGSIIHIKPVDKAASFEKILAHLNKSDDGKGSWLPESTDKVFNTRICENVMLKTVKIFIWEKPLAPRSYNRKLALFPKTRKHQGILLINHKPLKDH